MANEETSGNSSIGMEGDSFESVQTAPAERPIVDSNDFFQELEQSVNGGITDAEVTQQSQNVAPNRQPTNQDVGSNNMREQSAGSTDWQNRYKSSSKEAVKLKGQLNELKPFIPVLDAMKKDSGLVQHVRDYLVNGGAPAKSVKEQLNLSDDFQYDQNEAMQDPDSDSARVMNAHVDNLVQNRVGKMLASEKQAAQVNQAKMTKMREMQAFRQKHNMSDEQWQSFVEQAKTRRLTMDDVYHLINKEKANKNVAQNAKADVMNQMKHVRNMPTSASGANSQQVPKSPDDGIFDGILGLDDNVDNLFG